jgi:glycosyltransferase involved in cell wall biosynthesis
MIHGPRAQAVSTAPINLSLIIPAYNQRVRSTRAAATARTFLEERFGNRAELIMVDDGSEPEKGLQESELPAGTILVRLPQNLGKGGAIRAGVARARGEYIIFTDSDLPFSLEPIDLTLRWLAEDADIVIGDRLHPESVAAIEVGVPRQLSSVVYTWIVNKILGLAYADTQCGYKGYRAAVAKRLFAPLQVTSFAFEAEILLRAHKAGYRVRRQPLRLMHDEDTSVRLTRHAPRMLADVIRIAWRARRGKYDAAA